VDAGHSAADHHPAGDLLAMKSRLVWQAAGERTYVLVLDAGDEAFAAIADFAAKNELGGASLTALGAFERATVGWFDLRARTYRPIEIDEQCEGLSLLGDIAVGDDGKPSLHMHAVLGLKDGTTRGGHFLKGIVRPTLEVTIVETPAQLRRRKQPGLGIALIQP
jgi:predicted DNA-binding protein with PD1-like motif